MNRFRYRAMTAAGDATRGIIAADGYEDAARTLTEQGLHVYALSSTRGEHMRRLPLGECARALDGLARFMGGGLSVDAALTALIEATDRHVTVAALRDARRLVREGRSASLALESAGLVGTTESQMLLAAEHAGQLTRSLTQVAAMSRRQIELRSHLRKALSYPLLLAVTGVISTATILVVVIPRFAAIADVFGQELPAAAQLLVTFGTWLSSHWRTCTVVACLVSLAVAAVLKETAAASRILRLLAGLPGVRSVTELWESAAIVASLGELLDSGLPLFKALQVMRNGATWPERRERLSIVIARLSAGERLIPNLHKAKLIPKTEVPTLDFGERTGQLVAALQHSRTNLERAATERLDALIALIQPALVFAIGSLVALVASSLLRAMYSLRPTP